MRVPSHGSQTGTQVAVRARGVLLKAQVRQDGRIAPWFLLTFLRGVKEVSATEGPLF